MDLQQFFKENPRVAIAFSGGVDSSYLLYAALRYGARVRAYYVNSAFQPRFELEDARRLAGDLHADLRELQVDVLSSPTVTANPPDRCYHCKRVLFRTIAAAAAEDGFPVLLDGTNASDDAGDRPGMRALRELSVRSPLRECGLTKDEIRRCPGRQDFSPGTSPHTPAWPPASPPDSPLPPGTWLLPRRRKRICFPWALRTSGSAWRAAARKFSCPPPRCPTCWSTGRRSWTVWGRTTTPYGWTWRQEHEQRDPQNAGGRAPGTVSVDDALLALKKEPSPTSAMQKWTCTAASARARRR